jgi:hypothetical protein
MMDPKSLHTHDPRQVLLPGVACVSPSAPKAERPADPPLSDRPTVDSSGSPAPSAGPLGPARAEQWRAAVARAVARSARPSQLVAALRKEFDVVAPTHDEDLVDGDYLMTLHTRMGHPAAVVIYDTDEHGRLYAAEVYVSPSYL